MKSIKVKVKNKHVQILKPHMIWYADIAAQLERYILILAGRKATNRDGKVVIDGEVERAALCNNNEALINDCYFIYKSFVEGNSRTFACRFLGGRDMSNSEKKGRPSTKVKTQAEIENKKNLIDTLERLKSNKIIPFNIDTRGINYLETNAAYKMAIAKEVHAKLSSYEEQVKSTKAEFDALSQELSKCESDLLGSYSDTIKSDFKQFVADCNLHNHRIGFKFLSYIRNSNGIYKTRGFWLDKEGSKHRYSMKQEILDSMLKHKSIIDGDSSLLLTTGTKDVESYIKLVNRFEYKKEIPTYTAITPETCKLLLGNNNVKFKLNQIGDQLVWDIKSPTGEKIQFITNHKRLGKGKRFQLENLKIVGNKAKETANIPTTKDTTLPNKPKVPKEDGTYEISWSTNGKQPFIGTLCEPNIIFRSGEMYVQLPITIDKDEQLERIRGKIRTSLNRAFPIKTPSKKQKTIKFENNELLENLAELGRPLNVMGVDLGLNGIATAILTFNGKQETLLSTDYRKGELAERLNMANLVKKMNKLKEIIKLTAEFYKEEDTSEFYNECIDETERRYFDWLTSMKSKGIKLFELKHKINNWNVSQQYSEIRKEYINLKVQRLTTYDFINLPFWANTIKQFISLSKSYSWVGMESPVKKGNPIQNAFATSESFKTYQENYNNVKEDYAKKVANYIVIKAVNSNIDIISLEKLSSNLGDKDYKTKHDNEMFLTWNCGRIKFHIEHMAEDYGILITEVSEFETSKIHYQTKNPAYRDERNSEILWFKNTDNSLSQTHADKNAAINIAMRFISQHTNVYSYPIISCGINEFKFNFDADSKQMPGAAFKEFKDINKKFKNIIATDKNGKKLDKTRICKVNDEWVEQNKRKIYIDSIKTCVNQS